jgi:hypothetical protein
MVVNSSAGGGGGGGITVSPPESLHPASVIPHTSAIASIANKILFFIVFSFALCKYKKAGEPSYEGFRLFLRIELTGWALCLYFHYLLKSNLGGGGVQLSTPQACG